MAFKQKYKHLKKAPKSPHFSKMISFWANSFPFFPDVNKLELLLEKIFTLDLACSVRGGDYSTQLFSPMKLKNSPQMDAKPLQKLFIKV